RGLLYVFPLLRGVSYWLRYSSLSVGGKMANYDFAPAFGSAAGAWLAPLMKIVEVIATATLTVPLLANLRLGRKAVRRGWLLRLPADASPRRFLEEYATWTFLAAFVVFCLAPTTFMAWQGFAIFHAAVLPALLWLTALERGRHARLVRRGLAAAAGLEIALLLAQAFASPHYRCGGRQGLDLALRSDHPMLHELHIVDRCPLPLDQPNGWWPDVLPEASAGPYSSSRPR
ncbi:MAG TPA: hypothetical protein VN783_08705, partial [Thermoanaerobaculia bacterium]|nr:hypothetical protein [Thermoanaerobaculia bacterium]